MCKIWLYYELEGLKEKKSCFDARINKILMREWSWEFSKEVDAFSGEHVTVTAKRRDDETKKRTFLLKGKNKEQRRRVKIWWDKVYVKKERDWIVTVGLFSINGFFGSIPLAEVSKYIICCWFFFFLCCELLLVGLLCRLVFIGLWKVLFLMSVSNNWRSKNCRPN